MIKFYTNFVFILLTTYTYSQTEVSGNQSGTWGASGSPYLVTGEITVPAGESLTIEAGVTVNFQGHYKLTVNGTLMAPGTEQDSIFFTAEDTSAGWHGIRLTGSQNGSQFAYCRFEHGKTSGSDYPDQHGGALMLNGSDAVIDHCLFTCNEAVGEENGMGGAIYGISTGPATQITNCTFVNNNTYGEGGAIKLTGDNGANIENCIFRNNTVLYGGGAICLYGCYDTRIYRSLMTNNVTSYSSGGALYILGYCARVRIVNCTVYGNHATHGDGGGVYIAFSDASFTNSIIYNNPGAYSNNIYLDFGYAEVNYCNTPFPDGAEGDHNINLNAQFVDEAASDFHLLSTSPCIDSGIDFLEITDAYGSTFVVVDMDPSEYYNTAPDMGCYEYDPTTGLQQNEIVNFTFYPNPADDFVHINLPEQMIKQVSVIDATGKIVVHQNSLPGSIIDLTRLIPGVYIIRVKTKEGNYTGKVIKN